MSKFFEIFLYFCLYRKCFDDRFYAWDQWILSGPVNACEIFMIGSIFVGLVKTLDGQEFCPYFIDIIGPC
jgi:hypothetical protein